MYSYSDEGLTKFHLSIQFIMLVRMLAIRYHRISDAQYGGNLMANILTSV